MICLTGDVHHWMKGAGNQRYFSKHEINLAKEYLKIASRYGHKVTLFITGKTIKQVNESTIKSLFDMGNLEIGGHTFYAMRPRLLHSFFKHFMGSVYGPKLYQSFDIKRTLNVIKRKVGESVKSWRTHGYSSNSNTLEVLHKEGVGVISDEVNSRKMRPKLTDEGICSLPINVLPDHEHLYHADRTEEEVDQNRNQQNNGFVDRSYYVEQYFNIVRSQVEQIQENDGLATLLLHPACMKVSDDFAEFEKFCEWLAKEEYETIYASEVGEKFNAFG